MTTIEPSIPSCYERVPEPDTSAPSGKPIEQPPDANAIVTLVKSSGDKGQDVLVHVDGRLHTIVQCKNLEKPLTRPALLHEFMKLVLHHHLENFLPPEGVHYALWAPNGLAAPADSLVARWPSLDEKEAQAAFSRATAEYARLKSLVWDDCKASIVRTFAERIRPQRQDGLALSHRVRKVPSLHTRFFEARVVMPREEVEAAVKDVLKQVLLSFGLQPPSGAGSPSLNSITRLFEKLPIGPKPFARAEVPNTGSVAECHADTESRSSPQSPVEVLNLIGRYHLAHNGEPMPGILMRNADDHIAPLVRDRVPGDRNVADQVLPYWVRRHLIYPWAKRSYELTLWGWLDSDFGHQVRRLLEDTLAYFRRLDYENSSFQAYTWEDMKAARVVAGDNDLPLVRHVWAYLRWPVGWLEGNWDFPDVIEVLLSIPDHRELLRRRMLEELSWEARR